MNGDCERAIETDQEDPPYVTTMALLALGRTDEAIALCTTEASKAPGNHHLTVVLTACRAIVERDYEGGRRAVSTLLDFPGFADPEGGTDWALASVGLQDYDRALTLLRRAVDTGWHCRRASRPPCCSTRSAVTLDSRPSSIAPAPRTRQRRALSPRRTGIASSVYQLRSDASWSALLRRARAHRRRSSPSPTPTES